MCRLSLVAALLVAALAPAADPARYAVLVGVNQYQSRDLPALRFAVNDADALAKVLRPLGYKVILLTDASPTKPTKANVDAALKRILGGAVKGDTVLVGLSGHGLQFGTDKSAGAYFCPLDAVPAADRTDTLVAVSDLYRELDQSFAGVKVLLVDACRTEPERGGRNAVPVEPVPAPRGVAALYSCTRGQRSFEHPDLKHGLFFHHVIEGLQGKAASEDREITFNALADYVTRRVGATARELVKQEQTPNQKADLEGESPVLVRPLGPPGRWECRQGHRLLFGNGGTVIDPGRAGQMFRKSAELGWADGMAWYGSLMMSGECGIAQDKVAGLKWLNRGIEGASEHGLALLGQHTEQGRTGIPKDEAKALKLYRQGADAGHRLAMFELGGCYDYGRCGLPRDRDKAIEWYKKAGNHGAARRRLQELGVKP